MTLTFILSKVNSVLMSFILSVSLQKERWSRHRNDLTFPKIFSATCCSIKLLFMIQKMNSKSQLSHILSKQSSLNAFKTFSQTFLNIIKIREGTYGWVLIYKHIQIYMSFFLHTYFQILYIVEGCRKETALNIISSIMYLFFLM